MGTKGKRNTPITARVNAGLFNQKKGIKEPLLNVGPAGVYGDNQTRDIPSPSKIKGYSMKASPFKQEKLTDPVETKSTKVDIEVIPAEKTDVKRNKTYDDMRAEGASEETINKAKAWNADPANKDEKKIQVNSGKKTEKCPEGSTLVNGKCQKSKETTTKKTSLTKDAEDTQTARERSNTVRGGKRMNRKEKNAAIREAKAQAKIDNPDDRKARKKAVKSAKNNAKLTQAKKDRKLAAASGAGAQRQAEQNRSISARKTGTVKSEARVVESFDQSKGNVTENANAFVNGKPTSTTTSTTNPEIAGVTQKEIDGVGSKKTSGFFKTKSPMKKNYFK